MTWEIPDRNTWHKVEARPGTAWNDRDNWCRQHCTQRWIQQNASKITEFESKQDAVLFALVWA